MLYINEPNHILNSTYYIYYVVFTNLHFYLSIYDILYKFFRKKTPSLFFFTKDLSYTYIEDIMLVLFDFVY